MPKDDSAPNGINWVDLALAGVVGPLSAGQMPPQVDVTRIDPAEQALVQFASDATAAIAAHSDARRMEDDIDYEGVAEPEYGDYRDIDGFAGDDSVDSLDEADAEFGSDSSDATGG